MGVRLGEFVRGAIGMGGESDTVRTGTRDGAHIGSWVGVSAAAAGLGASLIIVVLGGMATMDEGGFVASGGPYEIARPVPEGFWLLPVAFIGIWVFTIAHGIFASRIGGFGLAYAVWCALWTSIGATTLWYGIAPPGDGGLVWGWLIMGAVFLLVGLGSTWLYVSYLLGENREASSMPKPRRTVYAALVLGMLVLGAAGGVAAFDVVVGL